jgi:hypothetical protein
MNELELIRLYFYLCECNDKVLAVYHQRFSNNSSPSNEKLTDVELLTIYFYCRRFEKKHSKSDVYDFAKRYLHSWFPNLPAYANFNSRINNLCHVMPHLIEWMLHDLENLEGDSFLGDISVMDSLPIMLCSGKRYGVVAPELSEKSYCSTKGIYYWGVKLHAIAFSRKGKLPFPEFLGITSAAENDLEAVRNILPRIANRTFCADKAYADKTLQHNLKQANSVLVTPIKLVKGESNQTRQFKKAADDLFSTAVSAVRQPIESFFNWLIQKTDIQNASKVRNTKGLLLHTFGALASALFFWLF